MPDTVEQLNPYNFGELKDALGTLIARGGDDDLSDTVKGYFVNAAEQFIASECGSKAYWLEHTQTMSLASGDSEETLPSNVGDVYNVRDHDNNRHLRYIDPHRWSSFIVDETDATGTPMAWTRRGFSRRTNEESPSQEYGSLILLFWPQCSGATTLYYDCQLVPGMMSADSDMPCLPVRFHWGLIEWAAYHCGAYDIGTKNYIQHERLAQRWLMAVKQDCSRKAGPMRMIGREEWLRRYRGSASIVPTRAAQLYGS